MAEAARPLAGFAFLAVAVLTIVLAVHWPGLDSAALCFDDSEYLTRNPLVQNPSFASVGTFVREVLEPSTVHGYYQPLTMISLMLDYAAGGRADHLLTFHRTSLLLHLANTLLIVILLYQLFRDAWAAGLAGLLFGVHPMTVENIFWVGERKTVLAAFFVLIALVAYVHYARRSRRWAYGLSIIAFVLGLLAKPTITPLPVCLLLVDLWPLDRLIARADTGRPVLRVWRWLLDRRVLLEKIPFLLVACVSAIITFESQRRTAVAVLPGQEDSTNIPYVVCHNIVFYLWKMVLPIHMSSNYAFPSPMSLANPPILAGIIGTAILIALLVLSLRRTRALAVGWLFFFVAISPTLGFIGFTNVIAADKYAYWPAVGILMALCWTAHRLRLRDRSAYGPHLVALIAVGAIAAMAFALGTRSYIGQWQTTEKLFRYMVALDDTAAAPLIYLGTELNDHGRSAEAVGYLERAGRAAPQCDLTFYNLGLAYHKLSRYDAAVANYQRAISLKPDLTVAHIGLGNSLLAKGDAPNAQRAYAKALDLTPNNADAHYNLANVLVRQKDIAGAVEHYTRAIQIQPALAAAHKNLAGVLLDQGQTGPAIEQYEQALAAQPAYLDVALHLANFYATSADPALRRPARAVQLAEHVVAATHRRDPNALIALATAYGEDGRLDQAVAVAREAMGLAATGLDPAAQEQVRTRLSRYLTAGASQNASGRQ